MENRPRHTFLSLDPVGDGGGVRHERITRLTDRQKWAYAWVPKSGVFVGIGSSSTSLAALLAKERVCACAVEFDEEVLGRLADGNPALFPVAASAMRLPFSSGSVDTVLLFDVLEHAADDRKVIDEVQRVLRPGGKVILSVPCKGLFRFFAPRNVHANVQGKSTARSQYRCYSQADLTRLLFLRFRVLERHYGGLLLYPLTSVASGFVQKRFRWDWSRFLKKLGDVDHDISWGRWSYSVILLAEKT